MRRFSRRNLASLACLTAVSVLLGGCLASGGTATIVPVPTSPMPTPAPTHTAISATATPTVAPTPTPGMPADFAFRFSVNWCGDLIEIDTINGTYTAEVKGGMERDQVSLALTSAELLVYYREIELLDPFSLPASLPYHRLRLSWVEYSLEVHMDGQTRSLFWRGHSWAPTQHHSKSRCAASRPL